MATHEQLLQEKLSLLARLEEINKALGDAQTHALTFVLPHYLDLDDPHSRKFFGTVGTYDVRMITFEEFLREPINPSQVYCHVEMPTGRLRDGLREILEVSRARTNGKFFTVISSPTLNSGQQQDWKSILEPVVGVGRIYFAKLKIFPCEYIDKPNFDLYVTKIMNELV